MVFKMVLTLSFFFTSLFAANFFDSPSDFNEIYKSKINQKMQRMLSQDWKNPSFNTHNRQSRDDEDLYGNWVAIDMLVYEDISFNSGSSVIDEVDFETLVFTFYDDNTLDIWSEYEDGEEEIDYYDWYTENDSVYIVDEDNDVESGWFEITESNQLVLRVEDNEMYPGNPIYLEYVFDYEGGIDEDCIEEGEDICESGYFLDQESCENNTICAWDDDQCWYACENDDDCDCEGDDGGYNDYGCGDIDACNYDLDAYYYYDDCIYPEDYGWCDCDGNIMDCSGECGGDDLESCTIMYSEAAGFYENSDCSGELITHLPGMCLINDYYGYNFYLNADDCISNGGIWLETDTCYSQSMEIMSEEDCSDNDGLSLALDQGCQFVEMPSQEDCEAQYGSYDDDTNECYVYDEDTCLSLGGIWEPVFLCFFFNELPEFNTQEDCVYDSGYYNVWLESEEIFEDGAPPNLYFFDDGTFSESCDYDCQMTEIPSEEDCVNAGGYYDFWGDCSFEEIPSQEDCETQGGYYDYYNNECYVDDENVCLLLGGSWDGEIECDADNEETCSVLNGSWYEGICPSGEYDVNGNSITITFHDPDNGPGIPEIILSLELDEYGNWVSMEWNVPDWYGYGNCIGFIWSSTPSDLSIIDPGMSLPEDLSIKSIYPNPFNPKTKIQYTLPVHAEVSISVYDIKGKQMDEIMIGRQNAGQHSVVWNANQLSSGVYFIRLQADDKIQSRNVILVK